MHGSQDGIEKTAPGIIRFVDGFLHGMTVSIHRASVWKGRGVALMWLGGRIEVALGWLWGGSGFPIGCLPIGFVVALKWLWVALPGLGRSRILQA
jgi:hypothetical protein